MVSSSAARIAFLALCGAGGLALGLKCGHFVMRKAAKREAHYELVDTIVEHVARLEDERRTTDETEGQNIGRVSCVTPQVPHDDEADSLSNEKNEFVFKGHSGGYQ